MNPSELIGIKFEVTYVAPKFKCSGDDSDD